MGKRIKRKCRTKLKKANHNADSEMDKSEEMQNETEVK